MIKPVNKTPWPSSEVHLENLQDKVNELVEAYNKLEKKVSKIDHETS